MEICRACNILASSVSSIFDLDTKQLFERCTYLNIELDDKLPTNICTGCLEKCKIWHEFQNMCIKNDFLFRMQSKSESISQEKDANILTDDFADVENILTGEPLETLYEILDEEELISNVLLISSDTVDKIKTPNRNPNKLFNSIWHETNELKCESFTDNEDCGAKVSTLRLKCYQCDISLLTINSLQDHLIDVHFTEKFSQSIFKLKKKNTQLPEIVETSAEIDSSIENQKVNESLEINNEQIKIYKCRKCPKEFGLSSSRFKHEQLHGEKSHMCSYCGMAFHSAFALNEHVRVHTNERPYKCNYCPMAFKRGANLIVHRRLHTNEKPYKCNLCSNAYTNNQALKLHFKSHYDDSSFKNSCDLCQMKFKHIRFLNAHKKRTHNIDTQSVARTLQCEQCPKKFKFPSAMSIHMRIHRNELPYSCKICAKSFRQDQHLYTHIKLIHKLTREVYNDMK